MLTNTPYVGLRPFNRYESKLFFGREQCVDELLTLLDKNSFFAVVGEAYCGKSSLVNCGLVSRLLENNAVDDKVQWHIVNFKPSIKPFSQLADSLLKPEVLGDILLPRFDNKSAAHDALKQHLKLSTSSLHSLLEKHPLPDQHKLLLICDQFETIFHLWKKDKSAASHFVKFLIDSSKPYALTNTSHEICVVLTMRSAYLDQCPLFPKLAEAIKNSIYLTPRLNKQQLEAAIIQPLTMIELSEELEIPVVEKAKVKPSKKSSESEFKLDDDCNIDNFLEDKLTKKIKIAPVEVASKKRERETYKSKRYSRIDSHLVEQLLETVDARQDQLPRLQHLLKRLWSITAMMQNSDLSLELYSKNRIGGFESALCVHLEEVYAHLKEKQPHIAEILFRQLTDVKDASRPRLLHVPVSISKVAQLAETTVNEVIEVVNFFRHPEAQFLLPSIETELKACSEVEIIHESIVRHWQRLHSWKDLERQCADNYQFLKEKVRNKKPELLHGLELTHLWEWSQAGYLNKHWADYYDCDYATLNGYLIKSHHHSVYKKFSLETLSLSVLSVIFAGGWLWSEIEHSNQQQDFPILSRLKTELITEKNSPQVIEEFKAFLDENPDNAESWSLYGYALMQQQQWREAIKAFTQATQYQSKNAQDLTYLGIVQEKNKDYLQAIDSFKKSLALDAQNVTTLIALADILSKQQKIAHAIQFYQQTLKHQAHYQALPKKNLQEQNLYEVIKYYRQALTFEQQQKPLLKLSTQDNPLDYYQQALEIEPQNTQVLGKIATTLMQQAKYTQAIKYIDHALLLKEDNEAHWRLKGLIYLQLDLLDKAQEAFNNALNLKKSDENWRQLGHVLTKQQQFLKASQCFSEAGKANPNNDKNWLNLGHVLKKLNKLEDAEKAYRKAINLNPNRENFMALADLYTQQTHFPEAIKNYHHALSVKPKPNWE